jgi:hypothetical protein
MNINSGSPGMLGPIVVSPFKKGNVGYRKKAVTQRERECKAFVVAFSAINLINISLAWYDVILELDARSGRCRMLLMGTSVEDARADVFRFKIDLIYIILDVYNDS